MTNHARARTPRVTASCLLKKSGRNAGLTLERLEERCVPTGGLTLNQSYVTQLYQDVLGRTPDPAGISYWSASLDAGVSRAEVAGQLSHTSEALTMALDGLYEHYLGRQADAAGAAAFLPMLAAGQDAAVQTQLLGSQEYSSFNHVASLNDFLAHLYVDVLGRPADADATAYFSGAQFAGDHTAIVCAVVNSPEANRVLAHQEYERFLEREPDASGTAYWADAFANGANAQTLAQAILGSDEYFNSPHANNDSATTPAGKQVTIDVASNDTRLFGRSYEVELVQNPTNGSAAVLPDGTITYAPSAGFSGTDILTYRLHTDAGTSSLGVVTITVEAA